MQTTPNASAGRKKGSKRSTKASCKELLRELWADKRSWKKRLVPALLAALAFSCTLFIIGPSEIYIQNAQYYSFSSRELILPLLIFGAGMFAVLTVVLMLLRGKIFNFAVTMVFWIPFCSYIQTFLPSNNLGPLDGTRIEWESMGSTMLLNLLLWAVLLLVIFIVLYFSRKIWRRAVSFISVLLIVMQGAGLLQVSVNHDFENSSSVGYLSNSAMYDVSKNKNTIVFLLDRVGYTTMQKTLDKYPELMEGLNGFTNYDNALGSYSRTFPSVIYLLTGVRFKYDEPVQEYFRRAWSEGNLLPEIKEAGYDVRLYTDMNYAIKDTSNIEGIVDNIGGSVVEHKPTDILEDQTVLSMYRHMPLALKPFFWRYSGDLNDAGSSGENNDVYKSDDVEMFEGLKNKGLSTTDSGGTFIFYHLSGAHDPFTMDADGNKASGVDALEQTCGNMKLIFYYINLLKEKGVYDDTTIIITADHGMTGTYTELSDSVKMGTAHNFRSIVLFVKPAGADTSKPMTTVHNPVSHDNIRSYILKSLGLDYSGLDQPIDEIPEDDMTPRYFYMSGSNEIEGNKRDYNLIIYKIVGDVKNFDNWEKISTERIKYPFYDAN